MQLLYMYSFGLKWHNVSHGLKTPKEGCAGCCRDLPDLHLIRIRTTLQKAHARSFHTESGLAHHEFAKHFRPVSHTSFPLLEGVLDIQLKTIMERVPFPKFQDTYLQDNFLKTR